jgi:hypothetical protein
MRNHRLQEVCDESGRCYSVHGVVEYAELYEEVHHKEAEGGSTHHVYDVGVPDVSMHLISESLYQMAKLAGKPIKS